MNKKLEQKKQKKNNIVTIALRPKADEYEEFEQKLEKLLEIYNVKTYSSLARMLIDAEIRRQGL